MTPLADATIAAVSANTAETRILELASLLIDAVTHGASVNFLAGMTLDDAAAFWRDQLPGIAQGTKHLLMLEHGETIVGAVMVMLAHQPNAPHRAEIGKMLVHSSVRRLGLGRRLLQAAERTAMELGRTLLMLDTEASSAGDLLYRACGWREVGTVPSHAYRPNEELADSTIFYKILGPHRRPA